MAMRREVFDPPSTEDFWLGSELERMVLAAEDATDQFVKAVDAHSEAEGAYLRVYHSVRARVAVSAKSSAEAQRAGEDAAVEERIAEGRAKAAMASAQALMRTRLAVLSAAQSHLRAVERQT